MASTATSAPFEIYLYETVDSRDGICALDICKLLNDANGRRVLMRINSPGGSVNEGIAIFNAMRRYRGGCDVIVDGVACSIASIIAMAGRRITMAKSAKMMIHSPYTVVQGNADDMRKMADLLDKYTETMVDFYQTKVRMTRSFVKDLLQRETWFNAYQCLELKFCDALEE